MKMGKERYELLLAYLREEHFGEGDDPTSGVVGRKRAAPKVDGGASG